MANFSSGTRAVKLTILTGTNRPAANSRLVAQHVAEIYRELGASVCDLNLQDLPPAIFHPSCYAEKPASFAPFSEAILEADGLVVVTPEYNGSMPGVLKYFIDMLKFPESFEQRCVAFVGVSAGMYGALRPIEQLQQIFGYRNGFIYPERVFIPGIGGKLDEQGKVKEEEIVNRLKAQAEGYLSFVEKLKR